MTLHVGTAVVDYAPPVGLPLMGNLREDYASTGVHDPLHAKAIVCADADGNKLALLALDICMVNRGQVARMRRHIASRCDIAGENVLVAATHIHSGPATLSLYCSPTAPDEAIAAFLDVAAQAVVEANHRLAPAALSAGYAEETRVSFYRRLGANDGTVRMNWEMPDPDAVVGPLGEIDPELAVLSIERQDGPVAAVVNFPLHPAVLDYANTLYSAGYPGMLSEAMKKYHGDDFTTLFFNGCCGNINHVDYRDPDNPRRGYPATQRIGYMLAAAAEEAVRGRVPAAVGRVAVSREHVALKRMPIDEETYRWSLEAAERMKTDPPPREVDGLPRELSAPAWIEMHACQDEDDAVEVMAMRLGDIAIVGLPGEVFCEFGREIKAGSPAGHTLVIELANDGVGYLPTREAFEQGGGYEVTPGVTRYAPGAGEKVTASALQQLERLFGG